MFNHLLVVVLATWVCHVSGYTVKDNSILPGWEGKKADIYFVLDSSDSVHILDYRLMANFVADLVRGMDIGPTKTRVGVGYYSVKHEIFLPIDNNRRKEDLVTAIEDTPKIYKGNGYMSRAIQGVRQEALSPIVARKDVPLIAVLFTDDEFRKKQLTRDNATLARDGGIFLYAIGIGRKVPMTEVRSIATDPKDSFAFYVKYFTSFNTIKEKLMESMKKVEKMQGDKSITCGQNTKADVLFVYDQFSLGAKQSETVKQFIKKMAKQFSMNSGNVRIGVISKSCQEQDISLGQYIKREDFLKHMDDNDGSKIISLLKRARIQGGFSSDAGGRPGAIRRIVLVLNGELKNRFGLIDNIRRAAYDEIGVYILNINSGLSDQEVKRIERSQSYVLSLDSIDHLDRMSEKFKNDFCGKLHK